MNKMQNNFMLTRRKLRKTSAIFVAYHKFVQTLIKRDRIEHFFSYRGYQSATRAARLVPEFYTEVTWVSKSKETWALHRLT